MIRRLGRSNSGSTAAEFALTLPLLLIFILGIVDAGRLAWEYNRSEKATQVGARVAVVTNSFPSGLVSEDYVNKTVGAVTLTQGDRIPAAALGDLRCTRGATCTCASPNGSPPCPSSPGTVDNGAFDLLVTRMQYMNPRIKAANVELHYTGSGLGYAGDPNGMDIAPIVTVKVKGMTFTPITTFLFATMTLPDFSTSLTAEDASGNQSN